MDKAKINSFITFKTRNKKGYRHSDFYQRLTVQLYNIAANQGTIAVVGQRRNVQVTADSPSQLGLKTPSRTPTFRPSQGVMKSPPKKLNLGDSDEVHLTGRFTFSGKDLKYRTKRSCWYCKKTGAGKQGAARNSGALRFEYPKTMGGCFTCNVPLCLTGACWQNYHYEFTGQNDSMSRDIWDVNWQS
jgi:hypothetical protein